MCGLKENNEETQWRSVEGSEAKLEAREARRPPELCNLHQYSPVLTLETL